MDKNISYTCKNGLKSRFKANLGSNSKLTGEYIANMINQNSDLSIEKLATLQIFLYTIMETRLKQINKYTKKAVY
jgi:hypothetical protein